MIRIFFIACSLTLFISCNNKSESGSETSKTTETAVSEKESKTTEPVNQAKGAAQVTFSVEGVEKTTDGSVLVQKDDSKLSAENNLLAMITANVGTSEGFTLNFLFTTKTGTYPVVGLSYTRDAPGGKGQVFGGLLGGKPKMTNYKVQLTKCEDLGSNGLGGHKWSISGYVEEEVTIDAMGIMKMDKEHPDAIKVNKISFSNLTFDDNWEEMMQKATEGR